jgi:hypothetical protein
MEMYYPLAVGVLLLLAFAAMLFCQYYVPVERKVRKFAASTERSGVRPSVRLMARTCIDRETCREWPRCCPTKGLYQVAEVRTMK